jgi:glucosamine-6-phosphate deaminase
MDKMGLAFSKRLGSLRVEAYESTEAMGKGAAEAAADVIRELSSKNEVVPVVFATGASQVATLDALTAIPNLPWDRVLGFHMDEYLGIGDQHPASFRHYMRMRLTEKVRMRRFYEIDGSASDGEATCRRYAELLHQYNPQLCLLGIGENGHLAFNDPAEADFEDLRDVKIVTLDEQCRQQQVNEGWFPSVAEVPQHAITLTIPALLRIPMLLVSVPEERKARIVHRTLTEEISARCPATIMRKHPNVTLYLDPGSASEVPD